VAIPATKPDPNFQLRATANANLFRVRQKDDIVVDIEVSQPGYYAVFNWQPHIDNSVFYVEINDKNTKVSTSIKSDKKFTLTPTWSEAYSTRRKFYDEYLIVVATKKELRWLSKYSYEDFSKALHLIPENEKRVAKIALQLTNESTTVSTNLNDTLTMSKKLELIEQNCVYEFPNDSLVSISVDDVLGSCEKDCKIENNESKNHHI
jgi:sulfur relay (sulfurtransferase) DsrC/TusE family protein